jgi:hypothetical protein
MAIELRSKQVGPYTVRELPMRETIKILDAFEGSTDKQARAAAMLGASVTNGTGAPLGDSVLDLGTGLYQLLMAAHSEVTSAPEFGEPGNG